MPPQSIDLIAGIVSFLLTVMVLSYLFFGDNPFFRIAIYLFVGVSAGYAAAVIWHSVLVPHLLDPLITPLVEGSLDASIVLVIIPFFFGLLLMAKLLPRTSRLGNWSVAIMVGVGTAVAIGGAVLGTLLPQSLATINAFDRQTLQTICGDTAGCVPELIFEASIILVGTVCTLVYFHFGAKPGAEGPQRSKLVVLLGWIGQVFIGITFGVLFAGVYAAALTALIERLTSFGSLGLPF